MKKHSLRVLIIGLLLCMLLGANVQAGWKNTKQGKRYLISKSAGYAKGWKKIKGKYYFFDGNGYMKKGWLTQGKNRYYLSKSTGARVANKWFKVGKYYYYADKKGKVASNQWIQSRYVLGNYRRASGWQTIGGKKYYFSPSTGKRVTGWKTIAQKKYYFDGKGRMYYGGWKKIKGKYYYLQKDGALTVNTWVGKYQVGKDGARTGKTRSAGLKKENGKYYYYNSSFNKVKGWVTYQNRKYYFGSNYAALTGLQTIGGKKYFFAENGVMQTGLKEINKETYYFGTDGTMAVNQTVTVDGITYTFGADGTWKGGERGKQIAQYALKFKGNPYVYGGNSLTHGVDCSGFTQQVMKKFKIYIPRVADAQRIGKDAWGTYTKCVRITPNTKYLQPGDLVFYGQKNYAGHVAIYIGNGKIIHASTPETGIIVSNYNYRSPIAARRYW